MLTETSALNATNVEQTFLGQVGSFSFHSYAASVLMQLLFVPASCVVSDTSTAPEFAQLNRDLISRATANANVARDPNEMVWQMVRHVRGPFCDHVRPKWSKLPHFVRTCSGIITKRLPPESADAPSSQRLTLHDQANPLDEALIPSLLHSLNRCHPLS